MSKFKYKLNLMNKKCLTIVFLFLIFIIGSLYIVNNKASLEKSVYNKKPNSENHSDEYDSLKSSALWAWLNLTDTGIDGKRFYHNDTIHIEGELYNLTSGIADYSVALIVDGILYSKFNSTTNSNGGFKINYTIPMWMNIYSSHKIEAQVTNSTPGDVILKNSLKILVNATSFFDIENYNLNIPQLAGDTYNIPGFLKYDNTSGIPSQQIDSFWLNETFERINPSNAPFLTNNDGSFKSIPMPPDDNVSKILYLNLTYAGNSPFINDTQQIISVIVFRNITCQWKTVASSIEQGQISINGHIYSRKFRNHAINFTDIRVRRNGASIGTATTDATGNFSFTYIFPIGTAGTNILDVELLNYPFIYSNITHMINVAPFVPPEEDTEEDDDDDDTPAPYQNFFMILIPIIIGCVAGFLIYAYFFLKKQEEESRLAKVPLEGRIINLKILKETGRMEEALSYLFQSIYLELINAKYGRQKEPTETIRDFAIISVKELNLNPASIYPFIQNIEKIIYDKPFTITEGDFYSAVDLFSPIYFELTGYNFILNF